MFMFLLSIPLVCEMWVTCRRIALFSTASPNCSLYFVLDPNMHVVCFWGSKPGFKCGAGGRSGNGPDLTPPGSSYGCPNPLSVLGCCHDPLSADRLHLIHNLATSIPTRENVLHISKFPIMFYILIPPLIMSRVSKRIGTVTSLSQIPKQPVWIPVGVGNPPWSLS
jgi:hypothetical protein